MRFTYGLILLFLSSISLNAQIIPQGLLDAISDDNAEKLASYIDESNIDVCYRIRGKMYSAFVLSIKNEAENAFNYLLEAGADVNQFCSDKSPLMYAAKYGQMGMLKKLVEAGADLNAKNNGKTAYDYSIKYKNPDIQAYLSKQLNR